ncbi:MAG: hypothetical protein RLZZ501_1073 [Pseudomonadota bacterium]
MARMILFTLRCAEQHEFEAWFRDNAAYEAQAAAGDIACPLCGDHGVSKAPMAPRVARGRTEPAPAASEAAAIRQALREIRRAVESHCDYVGGRFAEEARRIHYGECDARPIYGEATRTEARDLREEGVAVLALPWVDDGN